MTSTLIVPLILLILLSTFAASNTSNSLGEFIVLNRMISIQCSVFIISSYM